MLQVIKLQLQELRLDQAAGGLGIVKLAGALAKITTALAPYWLRSAVWQPLLNVISQACRKAYMTYLQLAVTSVTHDDPCSS